jgi:hypothetical protein
MASRSCAFLIIAFETMAGNAFGTEIHSDGAVGTAADFRTAVVRP